MNKIVIIGLVALLICTLSVLTNAAQKPEKHKRQMEVATFGGGCFWCTEALFEQLNGVKSVVSGYAGGEVANPTYEAVCSGNTGHAEVIQIKYNSEIINYIELLEVFLKTHDPTTLNQQGADRGSQYRSIILYHNDEQKREAQKLIELLDQEQIWDNPIVTEIAPIGKFYSAETHHQGYYDNNKNQPYCKIVITPKIEKFEKTFSNLLKEN